MNTFSVKGKKEGRRERRKEGKEGWRKEGRERKKSNCSFIDCLGLHIVSVSPTIIPGEEIVTHVTAHLSDPCSHLSFLILVWQGSLRIHLVLLDFKGLTIQGKAEQVGSCFLTPWMLCTKEIYYPQKKNFIHCSIKAFAYIVVCRHHFDLIKISRNVFSLWNVFSFYF